MEIVYNQDDSLNEEIKQTPEGAILVKKDYNPES